MTEQRGNLVIISSPSGAGKTTLSRRLLKEFPNLEFSVSYTTRPPRKGEVEGVDYHFVDLPAFHEMVDENQFAEWAEVHSNCYGTSRQVVEQALASGTDVVFDVDWQGGRKLYAEWPEDALMIFILPPDLETLEQRLRRRATDSPEVIEKRLAKAIEEMTHHREYEFRVINDDLESAYRLLRALYMCRRDGDACPEELQALVRENREQHTEDHADRLISAGKK